VRYSSQAAGERAYKDVSLPLKEVGAEMSPAQVDAMALEGLSLRPGLRVLEIGSGSGFTAALLAFIVGSAGHVTGVEVPPPFPPPSNTQTPTVAFAYVNRYNCIHDSNGM
jgi:protein-L-isoaspartate O-methyltransferase